MISINDEEKKRSLLSLYLVIMLVDNKLYGEIGILWEDNERRLRIEIKMREVNWVGEEKNQIYNVNKNKEEIKMFN